MDLVYLLLMLYIYHSLQDIEGSLFIEPLTDTPDEPTLTPEKSI